MGGKIRRDWKLTTGGTIVLLYESEEFWIRIMQWDGKRYVYLTPRLPIDTTCLLRLVRPGRQEYSSGSFRLVLQDHIRMLAYVNNSLIGWGGRGGFEAEVRTLLQTVGIEIRAIEDTEE